MKFRMLFSILVVLILTACNGTFNVGMEPFATGTATVAPTATDTLAPSNTPPAEVPLPTATDTLVSSATPAPTASSAATPASDSNTANYVDDRSNPAQMIISYYNAINRQEYLRAYDYWTSPSNSLGDFTTFTNGYKDTASVELVFGQITGDTSMSQTYYTVPVILKDTSNTGAHKNYAACYLVHAATPEVFGAPPFVPMGIDRGSATPSDINAKDATVLATACSSYPVGPKAVPVSGANLSIDKNNFVDNRSGPVETVSSLLNALNLKQYVRAYSYFQDPTTFPGPYGSFAAGYADTSVITATFGTAQTEGAAGSLYYKLPLAMKVLTTSGATQAFVGCYTLRLAQPAVQGVPPFQPMGITAGKFNQVDNSTDVNSQVPTACN
ncbi:MAG: hypothetical protein ABSB41_18330 [Anaerolineales bacterium]|jgi:hypothetical protein